MTTGTTTWYIKCDLKPLERRFRSLQQNIGPNTEIATREALEHIHQKAMQNLNTNLKWGHGVQIMGNKDNSYSAEEESIESSKVIDVLPEGNGFRGVLTYTSPHAKLMEFGGLYTYHRDPSLGPMPIGRQEGHVEYYGYNILGNIQGKYFLTSAFATEGDAVRSIYEKYTNKAVRESE